MREYSQEKVDEAINEMLKRAKIPNVLICGQTGTGKSSAVNFLFRDKVADVGEGEPCTRDIHLYRNESVNIYDSEGYEIGSEKQTHYEVMLFDEFLSKKKGLRDENAVHLIWYAISGAGTRFTELDIKLIKRMEAEHFQVCVLLTKIDEMDEDQLETMLRELKKELPPIGIFRLSIDKDPAIQKHCDWDNLIAWSHSKLPDIFKNRFVSGLKAGLEEKKEQAHISIAIATTAAAAVGVSPIPFSDAALLVPIQTTMILTILSIYGIKIADSSILSLVGSVSISALGKAAAGSIIKLIPGLGSIVGAAINATVAGTITGAIGKALIEICHKQCMDMLDGKNIPFNIETIITSPSFLFQVKGLLKEK
jgi:uncharacterized protein (DUF697 family)/GTP-binding protein EngB required for normal cell division